MDKRKEEKNNEQSFRIQNLVLWIFLYDSLSIKNEYELMWFFIIENLFVILLIFDYYIYYDWLLYLRFGKFFIENKNSSSISIKNIHVRTKIHFILFQLFMHIY